MTKKKPMRAGEDSVTRSDIPTASKASVNREPFDELLALWRDFEKASMLAMRRAQAAGNTHDAKQRKGEVCTLNVCIVGLEEALEKAIG